MLKFGIRIEYRTESGRKSAFDRLVPAKTPDDALVVGRQDMLEDRRRRVGEVGDAKVTQIGEGGNDLPHPGLMTDSDLTRALATSIRTCAERGLPVIMLAEECDRYSLRDALHKTHREACLMADGDVMSAQDEDLSAFHARAVTDARERGLLERAAEMVGEEMCQRILDADDPSPSP